VLICGQFLNLIDDRIAMKNVFVTGASSGIGLAIAEALVREGHEIWGTSRETARLPNLPRLHPVRLDLADSNSIKNAFNDALAAAGYIDVLINNAGSGQFGPAEAVPADELAHEFQVLVFGHLELLQLALKAMHARGSGLIINITSLAARLPVPFMAAYNAAKAAMAALTLSIQLELPDRRVRIVDLQPADIRTPFNESVHKSTANDSRYALQAAKTWSMVERNMAAAPKPELVARRVLELITATNPPPLATVGDLFQARIAPFIFRFLPQRVQIWGLKKYYGI
jgi:NAD(P)-dependent dehydrogenase (short-subunit alcohol dehydrogenase family)